MNGGLLVLSRVAFLLILSAVSTVATPKIRAQFIVCNKTSVDVRLAYAFQTGTRSSFFDEPDTEPVFYTSNWITVERHSCRQLTAGVLNRLYYIHAEDASRKHIWADSNAFCIPYPIGSVEQQRGIRCQPAGFQEVDSLGQQSFTYNLICPDCPPDKPDDPAVKFGRDEIPHFQISRPRWMDDLDWSKQNSEVGGALNCPDEYIATYPRCALSGGRSCLMQIAGQSARDNDCENALKLAKITQCHNDAAARAIEGAGAAAVCKYLGPPTPALGAAAQASLPQATQIPKASPYYVTRIYSCRGITDPGKTSSCKLTFNSSVSCQDAAQQLIRNAALRGDVCQQCTAQIHDSTVQMTGEAKWVQGGPCQNNPE